MTPTDPANTPALPRRRKGDAARRLAWNAAGFVALALGLAGVVLPILPTTPFVILAAFAFSNGSPRLRNWLLTHRVFGPMIVDWEAYGAIPRPIKRFACLIMAVAFGASVYFGFSLLILFIQAVCLSGAAAFILTRPDGPAPHALAACPPLGLTAAMTDPLYTALAQSLPATVPFVGPETQERQRNAPFAARLGANENVFGPSPKAIAAMQQVAGDIWMYGDPENHDLRHALAKHHGVGPQNIVVGEGIDGLLGYLVRLLVGPGDAVVTSDGAYPTFNYHVAGFGGTLYKVPYVNDHEDPASLFAKAAQVGAKLVYLANPDNPMGTWHSGDDIVAAMEALPDGCLLILDEAYIECAADNTVVNVDADDPRLIRMRTFSKIYGMAGARVGYGIGAPGLISAFNKVRNHFGMNRAAQAAALAALQDEQWLAHVRQEIATARDRISEIARDNSLKPLPSATNFVAIDCGRDGAFAKAVLDGLIDLGIFVRMPFAAPQNRCIRVSCGTAEDLAAFERALPQALAKARA